MKDSIQVAYDKEFDQILVRLGLKGDLDAGAIYCGFCYRKLDHTNVLGVYSDGEKLFLCCDNPDCGSRLAGRPRVP